MVHPARTAAVLAAVLGTGACTPGAAMRNGDLAALRRHLTEIEQFTTPDAERYLEYFADDLVLLPPDRPAIAGKRDALAFYRAAFAGVTSLRIDYGEPIIDLAGNVAVRRYDGTGEIVGVAGGPPAIRRIKYLDILRKQPDGTWKIAIHSWGANEPSVP